MKRYTYILSLILGLVIGISFASNASTPLLGDPTSTGGTPTTTTSYLGTNLIYATMFVDWSQYSTCSSVDTACVENLEKLKTLNGYYVDFTIPYKSEDKYPLLKGYIVDSAGNKTLLKSGFGGDFFPVSDYCYNKWIGTDTAIGIKTRISNIQTFIADYLNNKDSTKDAFCKANPSAVNKFNYSNYKKYKGQTFTTNDCASIVGYTEYCNQNYYSYCYFRNRELLMYEQYGSYIPYPNYQEFTCSYLLTNNTTLSSSSTLMFEIYENNAVAATVTGIKLNDAADGVKAAALNFLQTAESKINMINENYEMGDDFTEAASTATEKIDTIVAENEDAIPASNTMALLLSGNTTPTTPVTSSNAGDCSLNPAASTSGFGYIIDILIWGLPAVLIGSRRRK